MFLVSRSNQPPKLLGIGPEKFVPAQTLQLLDGKRQYLGSLDFTTDGVAVLNVSDAKGVPLLMYTTGVNTPMLNIYSYRDFPREKKLYSLTILTEPDLWFSMEPPSGKSTSMKGKGSTPNTGLFVALLRLAYQGAFPDKPENTVEKMIPSEDVRLVDREHHTVAVLGLSEAGEPTIALTKPDGRLVAIFAITEAGFATGQAKEWPTLLLFDNHGTLRVTVALGPAQEPSVSISEKADVGKSDLGSYALDPQTGKEISVPPFDQKAAMIPWLSHPMPRVALPVLLVDQRGSILWHSPSR